MVELSENLITKGTIMKGIIKRELSQKPISRMELPNEAIQYNSTKWHFSHVLIHYCEFRSFGRSLAAACGPHLFLWSLFFFSFRSFVRSYKCSQHIFWTFKVIFALTYFSCQFKYNFYGSGTAHSATLSTRSKKWLPILFEYGVWCFGRHLSHSCTCFFLSLTRLERRHTHSCTRTHLKRALAVCMSYLTHTHAHTHDGMVVVGASAHSRVCLCVHVSLR